MLGKFLSLIRDAKIASVFGLQGATDVYFYAITLIVLVSAFIPRSINTTVIPALMRASLGGDEKAKLMLLSNIVSCTMIAGFLMAVAFGLIAFWPSAVELLTPGFDDSQRHDLSLMILMGIPSIFFLSIVAVNRGYLQSEGRFLESQISELCLALVGIAAMLYFADSLGFYVLIIAIVVASILQIGIQTFGLSRLPFRYTPYINLQDRQMKVIGVLIVPVLISTGISDISKIVDQALGSTLDGGGLSALAFGGKINGLVVGICIVSLVTVIFPIISKSAASGDIVKLKDELRQVINTVLMITLPATVIVLTLSDNIVSVLFERGQFGTDATKITSEVLFFYSLGLAFAGLRLVLIKVFYSLQDTITVVKCAIVASITNIILNFVLIGPLAHKGLALATSLSSVVLVILLSIALKRRVGGGFYQGQPGFFIKMGVASLLMWFCLHFTESLFVDDDFLMNDISVLTILGVLGMVIYLVSLRVMRVEEVNWIFNFIHNKLKK